MVIFIYLTSKPSLLLLNLTKEFKLIFLPHQVYDISKQCDLKKQNYSDIVPHLFLLQIYTE